MESLDQPFDLRRFRTSSWWTRFRLSGGLSALSGTQNVTDRSIVDGVLGWTTREVESAETLIRADTWKARLWRAQISQPIKSSPKVLADFCVVGPNHLQPPWVRFQAAYNTAPLIYRRIKNALLFVESGLVMPIPFVAFEESHLPWSWTFDRDPLPGTDRATGQAPTLHLKYCKPQQVVNDPILSLCHAYANSFGHWFTDVIPPILDMLELVKKHRLRVLLPALLPWQRRTLQLLGVPTQGIVEITDRTLACSDLICHSFGSAEYYRRPGPLLHDLFLRLRSAPRECGGPGPKLIYVSRRALRSWRGFANEDDIECALSSAGFAVLTPERMPLDEQIAAFASAEVIVGPHGSAFANAGFAPPGCLLVDIVPEHMPHGWIYNFAHQLRHHLVILTASCEKADGSEYIFKDYKDQNFDKNLHYRIAPNIVTEHVFAAMSHVGVPRSN